METNSNQTERPKMISERIFGQAILVPQLSNSQL